MASFLIRQWLQNLDSSLHRNDISSAVLLFQEKQCFWRDLLAFTWNIYTAESRRDIRTMLDATLASTSPSNWTIDGEAEEAEEGALVQAFIRFETEMAHCRGYVMLRGGKCWCLLTSMVELKGYEEKVGCRREVGIQQDAIKGMKRRLHEREELGVSKQPHCLIVGGGQAGIALGARLRLLEVPTIIVEKGERPPWNNMYKSLCLQAPLWYDHLPYVPFPSHWPLFPSRDKMGDWLEAYIKIMELVYWSSTEWKSAKYDAKRRAWRVLVERDGKDIVLYPRELVLATGMSALPKVPTIPGAESFQGMQCHSMEYTSGENRAGKHCVVVGSNTSAFNICVDLWENQAASITMLQRSPTHIFRSKTLQESIYSSSDCQTGLDDVDIRLAAIPYKILHKFGTPMCSKLAEMDAPFYARLKQRGFMLNVMENAYMKYLHRGTGYYIDVGVSDLVINGDIKVKGGVTVKEVKPRSVICSDGEEIMTDVVVYATGFGYMNEWVGKLISQEVADKVGKCWGLGSGTLNDPGPWEGELRNMWKPTMQEGLWFHGGTIQQARHYSLVLALQLKARMEGIPTPMYGLSKVHHTT
ncbi:hypothetical protein L7F22_026757 [Adiantum nelumboides]|nr:hypothetical protein [Adiantum nelumboides]